MTPQSIHQLAASLQLPGGPATVVETHTSWVLLNEDYAFKIKRPVKLSFLDFSSPELRRYYCEREFVLNRRLAPQVYLQLLAISREPSGEWSLQPLPTIPYTARGNGRGHTSRRRHFPSTPPPAKEGSLDMGIDYAIQMVRLPDDHQMHRLLASGHIKRRDLIELAQKLATFHRGTDHIDHPLRTEDLIFALADLETVTDELIGMLGPEDHRRLWAALDTAINYIRNQQPLLNRRAQHGWRVDGHGDLHSRNIFLLPEEPIIFDCLEYNDEWRWVDVLDELAFLCVDFDFYGKSTWRSVLERTYFEALDMPMAPEDRQLFHYFLAYRSSVRLKVTALKHQLANEDDRTKLIGQAVRYSLLTQRYADSLLPVEI
ncbi:MAG: hypothetical protein KDC54_18605 [Lewinella sp.]|nr:hypothetical protein [Lewinella sp.]